MMSKTSKTVDPLTLTVIWKSLISIADEMGTALRRTAFSAAVREGDDFSTGLFDAQARLIAQGNFTPGHLGAMPYVVRNILASVPAKDIEPGDMIVTNDSYLGGGHFPDFYFVNPVFLDDKELIGYVVNTVHHVDVGGVTQGGQGVQGIRNAFYEGIRVLPVRLVRNGRFDESLLTVILGNVRMPEMMRGDLVAQLNANNAGAGRLRELFGAHGSDTMREAFDQIVDKSEVRARELVGNIPEGTFSFDDYFDDYGPNTSPIHVGIDVSFKDSTVTVDFSRSSDQVPAGLNSYINYTRAYAMFAVRIFAAIDVPHNEGIERVIRVVARPGSFFNPIYPAAGGGRSACQIRIFDTVNGALASVCPERAMGAFGHWSNPNIGGFDKKTNKFWIMYDLIFGGYGGQYDKDGVEALCPVFNCANVPLEIQEATAPVRFHQLTIMPDTGGAGKFRGGCGVRKDIEILADEAIITLLSDRHTIAPYGVFGGKEGEKGRTVLVRDGQEIDLGSKEIVDLVRGDIISIRVAGAGGYGPASERTPERIQYDIDCGYETPSRVEAVYGERWNSTDRYDLVSHLAS